MTERESDRDACVKADSTAGVMPPVKRKRHTDINDDLDANTGPPS